MNDIAGLLAHPKWLVDRWADHFGTDKTRLICEYDQRIPPAVLRLSAADEEMLSSESIQLEAGALLAGARVVISGDVTTTELFRKGQVAIQDEGSQLVAALVGEGKRILDCCAAPGSKTGALAARMPKAEIFAAELHSHRARLLRKLSPQENVHVVAADALALPFPEASFDRVLADVPCSGTGTLARNPEIKWRLKLDDLRDLQRRQIAILRAAMKHVAPGGRLVYSTCSLEPEENEQVVAACLAGRPEFRVVPVREELERLRRSGDLVWKEIDNLVSGDFLRTIPGVHPCDGFFVAILQKL